MKTKLIALFLTLVFLIGLVSCSSRSRSSSKVEEWPGEGLFQILPTPPSTKCTISSNYDNRISATVLALSLQDFKGYVVSCRNAGFSIDESYRTTNFTAFNQDGYKLRLYYYESSKDLSVYLDAPEPVQQISWPRTDAGNMVPAPKSDLIGSIQSSKDDYFYINVSEMSRSDYLAYVDECIDAGFGKNVSSGDESYTAENDSGYRLRIEYKGFSTISIKLEKLDESTDETEDGKETSKPINEESDEPERTIPERSSDEAEETTSTGADTSAPATTSVPETEPVTSPPTTAAPVTSAPVTDSPRTVSPTDTSTEPIPNEQEKSSFEIYFLDVDQGDAACVLCDGEAMLIDGGESSKSDMMYTFLRNHGITYLNCVVATHPDEDHVGGLAGALNYASVGKAFCTVTQNDSKSFGNFVKYLGKRNVGITVPSPGESFYLGSAKVTFIYPEAGKTRSTNTSIALRIEYGKTSFFFAGDCENPDESVILKSGYTLKSDVLKVAHHGSKISTGAEFLQAVSPAYAVISVGGNNQYSHPTEEVLSKLKAKGVTLFRTDINGDIHCTSDGNNVYFDVQKNRNVDSFIAAGGYQKYLKQIAAQETTKVAVTDAPPERTLPPETTVVPQETTTSPSLTEQVKHYILNENTNRFHEPSCGDVVRIKEENKREFTGTRSELISSGYTPCGHCKP